MYMYTYEPINSYIFPKDCILEKKHNTLNFSAWFFCILSPLVTQLPFGLWMCHKIFHSLSLSLQDFLVGVIIKRVIAQVGAATDFYLCGLNFFSQTPSSEGGGERGYGGGRVDDDKFGENNDGGDGRGSDGEGGSEIMEWDEGDPGGGGDDDDSGGGGGGGGGGSKGGSRLPSPYYELFWACMLPLLLPPQSPSFDDGDEEEDFEEEESEESEESEEPEESEESEDSEESEESEDDQGGNENSVTFFSFFSTTFTKK